MKLEVFSKQTRERIGMIVSFSFAQCIDKFNSIGSFSIDIPYSEEVKSLLSKGNYILLDNDLMGIIKYVYHSKEESHTIEVKGSMLKKILDYRVFEKTKAFSGTLTSVCQDMVKLQFIEPNDERKLLSYIAISDEEKYAPSDSPSVSKQVTGSSLASVIEDVCRSYDYGYDLVPKIVAYNESTDKNTNIKEFSFRVLKPTDRTVGNQYGNNPVVFSIDMNNLANLLYEEDSSMECSTAIVAGMGEGDNRTVVEVGDTESSGIDRIELYVDARDLQNTDEDGNALPVEKYEAILTQRGKEYLSEHKSFVTFAGTLVTGELSYTYGKDFYKGDYVTVIDKELNLKIDTQITEVIFSETSAGSIIDLTFGYEKATIQQLMKKKGVL